MVALYRLFSLLPSKDPSLSPTHIEFISSSVFQQNQNYLFQTMCVPQLRKIETAATIYGLFLAGSAW